jgi:hypothetical protein
MRPCTKAVEVDEGSVDHRGRLTPHDRWGLPPWVWGLLPSSRVGKCWPFSLGTSVSCKVGPSIHVLSYLAIERKHTCDPRVDTSLEVFGRIMGGLRGGSGPTGWLADPYVGPTTTQSSQLCTYKQIMTCTCVTKIYLLISLSVEMKVIWHTNFNITKIWSKKWTYIIHDPNAKRECI